MRLTSVLGQAWTKFRPALILAVSLSTIGIPAHATQLNVDLMDERAYAEHYGVSLPEASAALELQSAAGDLEADLIASEPETFAGLWIEHQPFRVVAAFTSEPEETLARHVPDSPELAGITDGVSAKHSLRHLNAVVETLVNGKGDRPFDVRIVERDSSVEVMVESEAAFSEYLGRSNLSLPPEARVRSVASLASSTVNTYGGLDIGSCTSGFSVRLNGTTTTGLTTAGHCGSSMSYQGTSLPFQGENFGGPNDQQWHTTPGFTDRNWVYNNAYTIAITSKKTRDQQPVGMFVCHMGQATLYGCGEINNKSFRPSYVPNATATFIQVSAFGEDLSSPGDSGGPWWSGNSALGVHSGQVCFVTCNDALYVAANYVEGGLGVTILTSS